MNQLARLYINRINLVINHINEHCNRPLPLSELAEVAAFSPFHFSRIFKSFVGESINQYIIRIRGERAANQLILYPERPITEIAYDNGFSSSANFSKAFKKQFNTTPSTYRLNYRGNHYTSDSKIGMFNSNNGKDILTEERYNRYVALIKEENMNVVVETIKPITVAYIRHTGPYDDQGIGGVWSRLSRWAGARGLFQKGARSFGVGLDNPEITPPEKCRYDACISIDESIQAEGEIGVQTIPGGQYAIYTFETAPEGIKDAYHNMYAVWLPENGFEPADLGPFEEYLETGSCEDDTVRKFKMKLYIPVKPA